jgi:hypothetical protein
MNRPPAFGLANPSAAGLMLREHRSAPCRSGQGFTMSALPPIKDLESLGLRPNAISAYNVCIDFESWAATDQSRICARVLGYLIIHAPSVAAAHEVVRVIQTCARNFQKLSDLGDTFINYFIRPCKFFFPFSIIRRRQPRAQSRRSKGGPQPLPITRAVLLLIKSRVTCGKQS